MKKRIKIFITLAMVCTFTFVSAVAVFAGSEITRKQTRQSKVGVNGAMVQCTVTYHYKNKTQLKNGKPYKVVASKAKKANFKGSSTCNYLNHSTKLSKSGSGYTVKARGVWFNVGETKGVEVSHTITGYKAPKK